MKKKIQGVSTAAVVSAATPQRIPRIIHQTGASNVVTNDMYGTLMRTRDLNPEYEYRYYDDKRCRDYIAKHESSFPVKNVLAAYDAILPGTFKADVWRLCVLWQEGGVYADNKMWFLRQLSTIIHPEDHFVIFRDCHTSDIYNAFMAFVPKHVLIAKFLKHVVTNIQNRRYGVSRLDVTGPAALGKVFAKWISTKYGTAIPLGVATDSANKKRYQVHDHQPGRLVVNGQVWAKVAYPNYRKQYRKTWHRMWRDRKIYVAPKKQPSKQTRMITVIKRRMATA